MNNCIKCGRMFKLYETAYWAAYWVGDTKQGPLCFACADTSLVQSGTWKTEIKSLREEVAALEEEHKQAVKNASTEIARLSNEKAGIETGALLEAVLRRCDELVKIEDAAKAWVDYFGNKIAAGEKVGSLKHLASEIAAGRGPTT